MNFKVALLSIILGSTFSVFAFESGSLEYSVTPSPQRLSEETLGDPPTYEETMDPESGCETLTTMSSNIMERESEDLNIEESRAVFDQLKEYLNCATPSRPWFLYCSCICVVSPLLFTGLYSLI